MCYVLIGPLIPLTGLPISWAGLPLMDWHRLFEIAILAILAIWSVTFGPTTDQIALPVKAGWAAVFALGLASAMQATDIQFALLEWSFLALVVLTVATMHQWGLRDKPLLNKMLLCLVALSSILYVWWFFKTNASIFFEPASHGLSRRIEFPGFPNIRFFSDVQSFMLLLLPAAIFRFTTPGVIRHIGIFMVALYFSLAFIVGSRSLIFAHLLLHVFFITFFGYRYWPYLKTQLKFWLGGWILFLLLTKILPMLMNSGGTAATSLMREDSSGRVLLWQQAWELIQSHPLLGVGPLHFAAHANHIASSPHNFPLQIATEWGLPASIILMGLLGYHLLEKFNRLKSEPQFSEANTVQLGMAAAALAALLQTLVSSSPFNYPVGQVVALLCFAYPDNNTASHAAKSAKSGLQFFTLVALGVCLLTLTTLQSIRERNQCFLYNRWPTELYAPRFWQQGWIIGPCGTGVSLATHLAWKWSYWKESGNIDASEEK